MPTIRLEYLTPDGTAGAGTVRVRGGLPGDEVAYTVDKQAGKRVFGTVTEVVRAGPHRREAPCAWHDACGGCDLGAMKPESRQQLLAEGVQRQLQWPELPTWVPSPRPTAYRARISLGIADNAVGYRPPRSHDVVAVGTCGVARPEVQAAIAPLRQLTLEGLSRVELRSDGERVVYAFTSDGSVPRAVRDGLAALGDVALDGRRLHGDPTLWLQVGETRLRASPRTFYQVNLEANAALVDFVTATVAAQKPERILDLYAGNGNLTLPLATLAPTVAVEREGQATGDLGACAGPDITVRTLAAERFDPSREPFDIAVLDPPRAGAPGLLPKLALNRPRAIVYVSCHLPSAIRDVRKLEGYAVTDVRCFDFFPDTHHHETVLVLSRQ